MHVIAVIDTRDAVAGTAPSSSREIGADGDDYAATRDSLAGQVPDGWMVLHYRVADRS